MSSEHDSTLQLSPRRAEFGLFCLPFDLIPCSQLVICHEIKLVRLFCSSFQFHTLPSTSHVPRLLFEKKNKSALRDELVFITLSGFDTSATQPTDLSLQPNQGAQTEQCCQQSLALYRTAFHQTKGQRETLSPIYSCCVVLSRLSTSSSTGHTHVTPPCNDAKYD